MIGRFIIQQNEVLLAARFLDYIIHVNRGLGGNDNIQNAIGNLALINAVGLMTGQVAAQRVNDQIAHLQNPRGRAVVRNVVELTTGYTATRAVNNVFSFWNRQVGRIVQAPALPTIQSPGF